VHLWDLRRTAAAAGCLALGGNDDPVIDAAVIAIWLFTSEPVNLFLIPFWGLDYHLIVPIFKVGTGV
jgi:hypothetical protein